MMLISCSKERVGEIEILLSVGMFGASIFFQRLAMLRGLHPATFSFYRYLASTLCLGMVQLLFSLWTYIPSLRVRLSAEFRSPKHSILNAGNSGDRIYSWHDLLLWGIFMGVCNCIGTYLMQQGIQTVAAGKAAFIAGMYVVFTPLAEWTLHKLLPIKLAQELGLGAALTLRSGLAALGSLFGMMLLSGCLDAQEGTQQDKEGTAATDVGGSARGASSFLELLGVGETLLLLSVAFWVASILIADVGSKRTRVIPFTLVNFATTALGALLLAVVAEPEQWEAGPHLAGIFSGSNINSRSGINFESQAGESGRPLWQVMLGSVTMTIGGLLLSNMGQRHTPASHAALLFSLEGIVTALLGWVLLDEALTTTELVGCAVMTVCTVLASASTPSHAVPTIKMSKVPVELQANGIGLSVIENSAGEKFSMHRVESDMEVAVQATGRTTNSDESILAIRDADY